MVELVHKKPHWNETNPIEHQRRLDLYTLGLTDKEIAEIVGVINTSIRGWRKKVQLKPNEGSMAKIVCKLCGKEESYLQFSGVKTLCSDCSKSEHYFRKTKFYEITSIRKEYYRLADVDINKAEEFRTQMIIEEGEEFTGMVLNGIIEKVRARKESGLNE